MTAAGYSFSFAWEVALMKWLQGVFGNAAGSVVSFFSAFGEQMVLILILGALYWGWNKEIGKDIGRNLMMGLILNTMVKNIFMRRRPYFDHPEIELRRLPDPDADMYDAAAQGWSFPSGHSTNGITAYTSLALTFRRKVFTAAAVILPLLIGFSRVVVGAHYPTDVICGWLFGFGVIGLLSLLRRKIEDERLLHLLLVVISLPGLFYCKSDDYFTALGLLVGFAIAAELEKRYVNFENTKSPLWIIVRTAGGTALFLILSRLLKKPFSEEFLASGTLAAMLVRSCRYMIIAILEFAVYPMVFRKKHT